MRFSVSTASIILIAIVVSALPITGAERSAAEVRGLIERTQKKVDQYRAVAVSGETIATDLAKIEDHIASARKLLEKGTVDQAFYEISIGIIYFILVDARIELSRAESNLLKARQKVK